MAKEVVAKIPTSESGTSVLCETRSGKQYRITQNPKKKNHTLWLILSKGFQKISTASSPYDLYKLIDFEH